MVERSKCGFTNSNARGTATWECMSTVMLFGRTSRPGRPCRRAAVGPYLFHCSCMLLPCCAEFEREPVPLDCAYLMHAQVLGNHRRVNAETSGLALEGDLAGIDDHDIVGDLQGKPDVLLHQHDRESIRLQLGDGAADL